MSLDGQNRKKDSFSFLSRGRKRVNPEKPLVGYVLAQIEIKNSK